MEIKQEWPSAKIDRLNELQNDEKYDYKRCPLHDDCEDDKLVASSGGWMCSCGKVGPEEDDPYAEFNMNLKSDKTIEEISEPVKKKKALKKKKKPVVVTKKQEVKPKTKLTRGKMSFF